MTVIQKLGNVEWLVRDAKLGEWVLKTHAEAQKRATQCNIEKLKLMGEKT